MEEYIKSNCRLKKVIPILYGNKDVWSWIETLCCDLDIEIHCTDDTIVQNSNCEILAVTLMQVKSTEMGNILDRLSNVIDDTKISLPWLDNRNLYASYENYSTVKAQLRTHKLTGHILDTTDYKITWLRSHTVKLIHLDCEIPEQLKSILKSNPNLFSVNLSFAYPWHQFWYIAETQQIDRLVLDVCANYWSSTQMLDNFDLIDLLQLQIAIRGPIENAYLYRRISHLIELKIDKKSTQFNINTHLFKCDKAEVHEDTLLYLIHQYGRHFREIIWLHDWRGTSLFDNCVRELNMVIHNRDTVELDLKRYSNLSAKELTYRLWSSTRRFMYTLKISNYIHFTGDLFLNLIKSDLVKTLVFDVGYHLNYFTTPGNGLDADEMAASDEPKTIRLTYKPRRSLGLYNGLNDFINFFKRVIKSEWQQKFFYLIIDGAVIENWSTLSGLNILSICFENIELNIKDMEELSHCSQISTLEFHDCANLNDSMLLKLIKPNVSFNRIKITGKTSITRLFFYMRAEDRLKETDSFEYDFAGDSPVIEIDEYDHIAEAKYYIFDDRIECLDDDNNFDDSESE